MREQFRAFIEDLDSNGLFDRAFYFYFGFLLTGIGGSLSIAILGSGYGAERFVGLIIAIPVFLFGVMSVIWSFLPDDGKSHFFEEEVKSMFTGWGWGWDTNLFFFFVFVGIGLLAIPTVYILRFLGFGKGGKYEI